MLVAEQIGNVAFAERAAVQQWDYQVVSIHARHNDGLEEGLRTHGQEGWELIFINMPMANEYQCVFRRPVG
jgi:hypothetical protein